MSGFPRRLAAPLAIAALMIAAPVLAQGAPPLSSMPPPPSSSDPTPKENPARAKAQGQGQPRKARNAAPKADADDVTFTDPSTKPARGRAASGTGSGYQRPQRYVPEEFDRDSRQGGGGMEPTMSSSGRPGMGMKF